MPQHTFDFLALAQSVIEFADPYIQRYASSLSSCLKGCADRDFEAPVEIAKAALSNEYYFC